MVAETTIGSSETSQWAAVGLKDEQTRRLSYLFTFPVGDGTVGSLELSNELSHSQMAQRLRGHTLLLPKAGAAKFVEDLVLEAAAKFIIKTQSPGWKRTRAGHVDPLPSEFAAFVTPGQILGPARAEYRWAVPSGHRPHVGQTMGSREGWAASIASLAEQSNYIAFAIMLALAGPLLVFANLPEDPAFNWVGETSVGKTTGAKVGASVVGHPDAIRNWGTSERGLEDTAAAYCDLMLVLNAAEKAPLKRRRELLTQIIHMLVERESLVRAAAVQEQLPNLIWRVILLSTSNRTGAQMAAEAGLTWDLQEAVRFIDIPIPSADEGGIFDRLGAVTDKAARGTELIRTLEKALLENYGVLFRPWLEYLFSIDPRERVAQLMTRFSRKTGPHTGLEDRVTRKFAVVYAAGKMADEAGLLQWPSGLPLSATKTLLARAKTIREGKDPQIETALNAFAQALDDEDLVRPALPGKPVRITDQGCFVGVRYHRDGKELVGVRMEGLVALVGSPMVNPVIEWLRQHGAILLGHGGKTTQQLPITLKIGAEMRSKPRFLVIDARHFAALRSGDKG